jgi:hypothetical protein
VTYIEVFVLLQVLDFLTTLVGLRLGAAEMSPFIAWLMRLGGPLAGLTAAKLIGLGLGGLCLWLRKPRAIQLANYYFAALVSWNMWHILVLTRGFAA